MSKESAQLKAWWGGGMRWVGSSSAPGIERLSSS